ncbi:hypothetical protein ACOT81_06085 [Streptomyces sp. WI04-05B]|uniref:hypothetical protein n=1 Tax=Streptomyces TaxID=1883 RepID=UPI00299FB400|nr:MULTISPECIES: hypothetical protein [unclassified Streptomyces]MDX2545098.1 hypothetical protein [Streptomyces sp. WI04-05B]MDX2587589.1 hypothetical protein [Streptomyces sp. WI04-05A]MDX3748231.1 hypothetical protein [Streptomyces sp. AK08-02]
MVEAARPFRAGTRFQALPDVRFLVDGGRIRAPGDLLPGPRDTTAQRYGERLDHQMDGQGRLLVVEQPLVLDHILWAQVRALVTPLWDRAGYPVLPVITELVLGERITEGDGPAHEPRHSTLTWVLHGTVTATPRGAQAGPTLSAGAGDLLHWPAGRPHRVRFGPRTLAMRLLVPREPRLLNAGVKDVVAEMMHKQRDHDRVPYLPFPPGDVPTPPDVPELRRTAELLRETTATPHLDHALSAVWARRVSAAALEPAPRPRPPARLSPGDRLRPASAVVRMPLDNSRTWLWAIDGHAFHLRGSLGERVLNRLRQGDIPTVRQLCAVAGPDRDASVLALLEKLYTLRGVDVVGQEDTA